MQLDNRIIDIAHVIQLAVAPVFLLSGVGITLTVLTNRLARIIDRARVLEGRITNHPEIPHLKERDELKLLGRRAHIVHLAITLGTMCALLIAVMIIALFAGAFLELDLSKVIGGLFVVAMLTLVGALLGFLREIYLATGTLRFGE